MGAHGLEPWTSSLSGTRSNQTELCARPSRQKAATMNATTSERLKRFPHFNRRARKRKGEKRKISKNLENFLVSSRPTLKRRRFGTSASSVRSSARAGISASSVRSSARAGISAPSVRSSARAESVGVSARSQRFEGGGRPGRGGRLRFAARRNRGVAGTGFRSGGASVGRLARIAPTSVRTHRLKRV